MKTALVKSIRQLDMLLSPFIMSSVNEQSSFNTYLFHSLFESCEELTRNIVDPQQRVTVKMLREFIIYHKSKGYEFVSPSDVLNGLDADRKFMMITFDDGYYNNIRALPLLEEFNVPATIFVSANHVLKGKAFWWDVAYREGKKHGMSDAALKREKEHLLTLTDDTITASLTSRYGPACFTPVSDLDRPLTPEELNKLAQHPLIYIGNHTCDHAVLPNYCTEGIEEQIVKAQDILEDIVGYRPVTIAYPCGETNDDILQVCEREGIRLGITTHHAKNYSPQLSEPKSLLKLNRFTLWGHEDLIRQCDFYRSDYHVLEKMRKVVNRLISLKKEYIATAFLGLCSLWEQVITTASFFGSQEIYDMCRIGEGRALWEPFILGLIV